MTDIWAARGKLESVLAAGVEHEGRKIEFDVREDEQQMDRLNETIDLLLTAGYFRARIKTLSAFDKVVGGMVWCITVCSVDVDADLLFQENASIGQKISLTEKIITALSLLKCPHRVEPHQIQGLDMIHIFPVIQWLVKKALELREEFSRPLRRYACWRYEQRLLQMSDTPEQRQLVKDEPPKRLFRRKKPDPPGTDILTRVRTTLAEYGEVVSSTKADEAEETVKADQHKEVEITSSTVQELTADASCFDDVEVSSAIMDVNKIQALAAEYAQKTEELAERFPASEKTMLEKQIAQQKATVERLKAENEAKVREINEMKEKAAALEEECEALDAEWAEVVEMERSVNEETLEKLRDLTEQHDEVKRSEHEFKQTCKQKLQEMETELERLRAEAEQPETEELMVSLREERDSREKEFRALRLKIAKQNYEISDLERQLDEVPSDAELDQYKRRFLELYEQVTSKHKETKQFYLLYNTLTDVDANIQREVTLLDSLTDSYANASVLQSPEAKAQLRSQLQAVLDATNQNYDLVNRKHRDACAQRDMLQERYASLLEKRRQYYKCVSDLQAAVRKHEELLKRREAAEQ